MLPNYSSSTYSLNPIALLTRAAVTLIDEARTPRCLSPELKFPEFLVNAASLLC